MHPTYSPGAKAIIHPLVTGGYSPIQTSALSRRPGFYSFFSVIASKRPSHATARFPSYSQSAGLAEGAGTAFDFSVTVESEVGAGGFTVGSSAGFHQGYEYFVTDTYNTFYQGVVGHIPDAAYTPDKAYQLGLFTFPYGYAERKFTVVNYWAQ